MKIENNILLIDEPLENEKLDEFLNLVGQQEEFDKIIIRTQQLDSLIIQAIACFGKEKEIECEDPFLSKVFNNIVYTEA